MAALFDPILVAEDASAPAEGATRIAVALAAQDPGTRVLVAHVADTRLLRDRAQTYGYDPDPILRDVKDEMSIVLDRAVELAAQSRVPAEQLFLEGDPPAEFLALAQKRGARLIVVGSHGRRGLQRLFLGSFAEHVVRSSPCPVLVVREAAEPAPAFRRILVPIDGSHSAAAALDLAIRIAGTHHGAISLLHALDVTRYVMSLAASPDGGFTDTDLLRDSLQANGRALLDAASARVAAQKVPCDDRTDERSPWEAIDAVAADLGADAVVMGTHGRHGLQRFFLGSTAERVLRSSKIPVMVVRAADATT